jgi:hypothetical protein
MATSIDKSVNWRNAAATPDYQVTAQRVDTFVQGERNTRGEQVAAALDSAAGTLSNVAKTQAVKQQREQTKAEKQAEALDKLQANNESASQRELATQWLADTDISSFATPDQALEQYAQDNPSYGEAITSLTTDVGRITFGTEFGDVFNQGFYEKHKELKDFKTASTLNVFAMNELNKDGQTDQAMSVDDPRFTLLVQSLEGQASTLGYETPQSQYELLAAVAEQQYRETQDVRLFDYLQGNVKGRNAIGGTDFQNSLATKRESIRKLHLSQDNEARLTKERDLKQNKVLLGQEVAAILMSGEGDLLELANKYTSMGVASAMQTVKSMKDAHEDLDDVNLDSSQYSSIWQGFLQQSTPMDQMAYLNTHVANDTISKPLLAQLYSRIGNDQDKAMFNNMAWKSVEAGINTLSRDRDSGMALAEFTYLDGVGKQLWIDLYTSPEFKDMGLQQQIASANNIVKTLMTLKETDNSTNAIVDGREEFGKQQDIQQTDLQVRTLSEPVKGETPAEALVRDTKLLEAQERLRKLRED